MAPGPDEVPEFSAMTAKGAQLAAAVVLAATLLTAAASAGAAAPVVVTEEFSLPALDPLITLYVRNKHRADLKSVPAERVVLFVHGATWPSEVTFDLKLNGISWMDYIALRGYDVYFVDLRGYGRSTRPAEMDAPAAAHEPLVRTATAVKDLSAAVDFVLRRRGVQKLDLLAWSWGTSIASWYTVDHNDRVAKLTLVAPFWLGAMPAAVTGGDAKLGAYRSVTREGARAGWLAGVPADQAANFIPPGWFEAFAAAAFASDPAGAAQVPPVVRAPLGVVADNREFWSKGKPLYDPAQIRVPTFLAHGEWDAILPDNLLYAYFARLTDTPYKRYVEIGEATHYVMIERNRMQLFEAVQQFLDEDNRVGQ
jgi:pimeloyl-ACP methyl ester carboxylesterase